MDFVLFKDLPQSVQLLETDLLAVVILPKGEEDVLPVLGLFDVLTEHYCSFDVVLLVTDLILGFGEPTGQASLHVTAFLIVHLDSLFTSHDGDKPVLELLEDEAPVLFCIQLHFIWALLLYQLLRYLLSVQVSGAFLSVVLELLVRDLPSPNDPLLCATILGTFIRFFDQDDWSVIIDILLCFGGHEVVSRLSVLIQAIVSALLALFQDDSLLVEIRLLLHDRWQDFLNAART